MNHWSLSQRLIAGFGVLVATLMIMMVFSLVVATQVRGMSSGAAEIAQIQRAAINFRGSAHDRSIAIRDVVLARDAASRKQEVDTIAKLAAFYADSARRLDGLIANDKTLPADVAQLYRGIQDIERRTVATTQRIVELVDANKPDEAWLALWNEAKPQYEQWLAAINRLIDFEEKRIVGTTQSVVAGTAFEVTLIALIGLAGVLVGLLASFLVYRRVTSEMGGDPVAVRELLGHMREGNLSVSVPVKAGDRHSVMAALSDLRNRLGELIGVVKSSSDSISMASGEVAAGNQDLSGRTEAAANSLQQTASSVEQLTATVRQSADSARQANQLASSAAEVAQRGGVVVNQVVATMQDIHDSSRKISDIISVIDGIAFQTNILALNAAVEAARAGDQGRGFAVVAGEVRTLAQRSAQAAREIAGLINTSVDKVQSGSRLVQDAGSTMTDIVTSVQRVTDVISEISAAADEQSHGIDQVNAAIGHLDQMTQQNAALVEESAAAAASLQQVAERLTEVVSAFRVDETAVTPLRAMTPQRGFTPPPRPSHALPKTQPAARVEAAPKARLGMSGNDRAR